MPTPTIPGNIPSLTIGGRTMTDVGPNLIILIGRCQAGNFTGLRKLTGSAGYTPSGAKKFRACAYKVHNQGTVTTGTTSLGYADTDAGADSTVPTTPVYMGGASINAVLVGGSANGVMNEGAIDWEIPNGKYGFMTCSAGNPQSTVIVYGYEV